MPISAIDTDQFNRIARRNVTLPLVVGLVSAGAFLGFFLYFMTVTGWVDHTHQVIGKLNELTTLQADMESGERGYVVTGDESFLAPYQLAKPQLGTQLDDLIQMTADNPVQTDRLKLVRSLQTAWELYAQQIIELRRQGGDAAAVVKSASAKQLSDRVRTEVVAARASEQSLLKDRLDTLQLVTWFGIGAYILFIIVVNCYIAWAGRRDIKQLSHDFGGALKAQTDAANVLSGQAWVRDGQAQLAETLIGSRRSPPSAAACSRSPAATSIRSSRRCTCATTPARCSACPRTASTAPTVMDRSPRRARAWSARRCATAGSTM